MKGYRFFVEYENKTERGKSGKGAGTNHNGNVIAVLLEENDRSTRYVYLPFIPNQETCVEAIGSVFAYPNSPVSGSAVAVSYLREQCKRIPESIARIIHPNLFDYLES